MNKKWPLKAIFLGLSFFLAIFFAKPIGVSTQFSVLSAKIYEPIHDYFHEEKLIKEDKSSPNGYSSTNPYLNRKDGKLASEVKNLNNYNFIFFVSIFVGAFISYQLFFKNKTSKIKRNVKERSGYFKSFIAGFLLLFGARLAGGCTSGHMMSGIMQSSLSGFAFALVVFAVAIPLAIKGEKR